jgi:hypothetical protein
MSEGQGHQDEKPVVEAPKEKSDRLTTLANVVSNIKTLVAVLVTVLAGVFGAGWYLAETWADMKDTIDQVEENRKAKEDMAPQAGLAQALAGWSERSQEGGRSGLGGGDTYNPSMCPDGYYVVGIRSWGAPGPTRYCVGCLVAVQAICKPLPVAAAR